jgi:hypothetical protein
MNLNGDYSHLKEGSPLNYTRNSLYNKQSAQSVTIK